MLPIFEARINNSDDGIMCISLVDFPATETDFVLFGKQEDVKFSIDDEEKHILSSVVMVADTPIYRRTKDGYEYNIIYHKETIAQMAEKLLSDGTHNTFDLMHNGDRLPKGDINIVELYIVDKEKGISPNFIDVPDGSLMASYKIHNEELWQMCKDGTFKGISLEGLFSIEQEKFETQKDNNIKTKFMSLLDKLKDLIVEVEAEQQEPQQTEEIVEAEEQKPEETETEPETEPEPQPKTEDNSEIEEIKAKVEEIVALITDLGNRITAIEEVISKPVETPIEEQPIEEAKQTKFEKIAEILNRK